MNYDLYIACCTPDGGIAHCRLTSAGDLELLDWLRLPEPMYLAFCPQGLRTVLRQPPQTAPNSGVLTVDLLADGSLGAGGTAVTTGGEVGCHLCLKEDATYVANYVSGSVARIVGDDCRVDVHTGHGSHPTRQTAPHTHYIAPSPDGKYLLSTDLGLDTVYTYDTELNTVSTATVPAGAGARHLAYSPDGQIVYCANELAGSVTAFAYADGQLTPLKTVSVLPADFTEKNTTAAIRVVEDVLYVSNRGHDSIAIVRLDGKGGMALQGFVPCGGNGPRDFDVFGEWLVCTNEDSDTVTLFRRRGNELCPVTGGLALPHPLCVVGKPCPEEDGNDAFSLS